MTVEPESLLDRLRHLDKESQSDRASFLAWLVEMADWNVEYADACARDAEANDRPQDYLERASSLSLGKELCAALPEIIEAFGLLDEMKPRLAKDWRKRIDALLSKVSQP